MKSALGMCFNWKVLAGLAIVAVGVLLFVQGAAVAMLPLLLLLACPLSMGVMMFAMRGHGAGASRSDENTGSVEAKRARLASLREEESRIELELSSAASRSDELPSHSAAPAATSRARS